MIELNTRKQVEVIDIISSIEQAVKESGIERGICLIYTPHTTTGIVVNEGEFGLIQDITSLMVSLSRRAPATSTTEMMAMLMPISRRFSWETVK